jgi:hypothetical protein
MGGRWHGTPARVLAPQRCCYLAKIRGIIRGLAEEANLHEPQKFAQIWHMLMKGSIISAGEGNRRAAREAKCAARLVLKGWDCKRRPFKKR